MEKKISTVDAKKAYQKAYRQLKGRAYYHDRQKAYRQSEKGKAYFKAYWQSEKGKAYFKAYQQSDKRKAYVKAYQQLKGKANQKAYRQSEKGKAYQKAYREKVKQALKEYKENHVCGRIEKA